MIDSAVLDAIDGQVTANVVADKLGVPVRDVVAALYRLRFSRLVIRSVGDPTLPPERDVAIARWRRR